MGKRVTKGGDSALAPVRPQWRLRYLVNPITTVIGVNNPSHSRRKGPVGGGTGIEKLPLPLGKGAKLKR